MMNQSSTDAYNLTLNRDKFKKSRSYFKARRTEYTDISVLESLLAETSNLGTFGNQKLEQLIEHSLISVTVIEQTKRFEHVTGFASFNDTPRKPIVGNHQKWVELLQSPIPSSYFSSGNSMFLTSFVSEPRSTEGVLEETLKVLFTINPELDYCLLLTEEEPDSTYTKFFPAWMEFSHGDETIFLSVCKKEYIYPNVLIREAYPADVPHALTYFEKLDNKFREKYGDEWLERVVRASSTTAANIDWEYLDEHYETGIFHQFMKITEFDRIAGRLPNCDVGVGVSDHDEDPVFGPRNSVPSTATLDSPKPGKKQQQRVTKSQKSLDDLTPSTEEYIADLLEELCNITITSCDDISSNQKCEIGLSPSPSLFACLSAARKIVSELLQNVLELAEPMGALSQGESSVIGPGLLSPPTVTVSSTSTEPDVLNDELKNPTRLNVVKSVVSAYAAGLEQTLTRLSDSWTVNSGSPVSAELINSIQALLDVLEENGAKILGLQDDIKSTSSFTKLSEATFITIQQLINDLENMADLELSYTPIDAKFSRRPVVSPTTLTTLQTLINQLEETAAEIAENETHLTTLKLIPRKLRLALFYEAANIDLPSDAFQLHKTNIENLCPAISRPDVEKLDRESDTSIGLEAPLTTARLPELVLGVRNVVKRMNFGLKKPTIAVYDSAAELSNPLESFDGDIPYPRKMQPTPEAVDGSDEKLMRILKQEYGIKETFTEPLFSSWDDLVHVPQAVITNIRQEPGVRHLQRRCSKFYQNPVLGRSHEFSYIPANGEQNAMYLFLFHLDPLYGVYLDDIVAHCFRALPGHEYILTQIPTSQRHSLLLNKFIRVALRSGHFLREDLYAFNIVGLIRCDDLDFTEGSPHDLQAMKEFLDGKADGHFLLQAFKDAVHYHASMEALKLNCLVLRVENAVVGFIIFSQETDVNYLMAHYNVDDLLCQSLHSQQKHLRIHHYIINPMLNNFTKFILKELMRISDSTSIFYRFYPLELQPLRKDTLPCCLEQLWLVRPRSVLSFQDGGNWRLLPPSAIVDKQTAFALYHINRRLLYNSMIPVMDRIVLIGASDMSLQVLRNLTLSPYNRYINLILISPHGIPITDQDETVLNDFPCARSLFTRRELNQLACPANCQILFGKAVTMDKGRKILHVNDKLRIPFDQMVIGTGTQYLGFEVNVDMAWLSNVSKSGLKNQPNSSIPQRKLQSPNSFLTNYFVINDAHEADSVMSKIESLMENIAISGYFVVYGTSLDAYGCVTTLLRMGIQPEEILFVSPIPDFPASDTVFSTKLLETWVKNLLYTNGVVVIMEWVAVAYNEGDGGDTIRSVTFWTDEASFKTYHVQAFFNFTDRQIHPDTYRFLNSSYLVMDRKLVIDEQFHAFSPMIFAGGTWCKYPRRHYIGDFDVTQVNSREIGDFIATELLHITSQCKVEKEIKEQSEKQPDYPTLPEFRKPVIDYIELPFGWFYCYIRSPQNPVAGMATVTGNEGRDSNLTTERRLLSTGSIADGNLFEIYLSEMSAIDQIVCLCRFPVNIQNLVILHGVHEGWLELVHRFEDGYIKDFFCYIQELWLSCVLFDRFPTLCGELRRLVLDDQGDDNSLSVIEMINQSFRNRELPLARENSLYEEVFRRVLLTGLKFDAIEAINNFLENNNVDLPMYGIKTNLGEHFDDVH